MVDVFQLIPRVRCRHRSSRRHDLRLPALHRHPLEQDLRHVGVSLRFRTSQDRCPQAYRQTVSLSLIAKSARTLSRETGRG